MRHIDERDVLINRIARIQHELARYIARSRFLPGSASNLTMRQLQVTVLLSSLGSASGQDLARHLGVGLATVSGIVDRLVRHGLASRHEDPADRRVRRVELTPKGKALIEELQDTGLAGLRRILDHLDLDTLRMLDLVGIRMYEAGRRLREEEAQADSSSPPG
ncbi:MarR family winged helix-turn-helix transcriptional regulator [Spongiactinospora sp. 9N601]|uniref:MarR family winged helix-turn-helix transcriptional regulator n=1 Tax=Spongiactinospora sp. 9N601 TaxID=3375149 RepID=UPI0037AB5D2F